MGADGIELHRSRPAKSCSTFAGDGGEGGSSVVGIRVATDEAGDDQLVDDATHPGAAEHRGLAEVLHSQPAVGGGVQLEQHVVPGEGQARPPAHLDVDSTHGGGMGTQEGRPGGEARLVSPTASRAHERRIVARKRVHTHI